MTAAATHTGGAASVLDVLLSYWWLFLIFGGTALEIFGEMLDVGVSGLRRRSKVRHKRRLELKRIELEIEQAKSSVTTAQSARVAPGPCVHRNVTPVIAAGEDTPCAWLCRCGERLPADWAVREEDL